AAKADGRFQSATPKDLVDRFSLIPSIQANMDPAATIEDSPGDKARLIRAEIDNVAIGRTAFNPVDGRIEHPRMPAEKRSGFSRFKQDTCQDNFSRKSPY